MRTGSQGQAKECPPGQRMSEVKRRRGLRSAYLQGTRSIDSCAPDQHACQESTALARCFQDRTNDPASSSCTPRRSSDWCCSQTCPLGTTSGPVPRQGSTLPLCTVRTKSPPAPPETCRQGTQCTRPNQARRHSFLVYRAGVATSLGRMNGPASRPCTPRRSSGWCCSQTCPLGTTSGPVPRQGSTLPLCTVRTMSPPARPETCRHGTECTRPNQARRHSCPHCKFSSVLRRRHRRSQSRTQSSRVCHQRQTN